MKSYLILKLIVEQICVVNIHSVPIHNQFVYLQSISAEFDTSKWTQLEHNLQKVSGFKVVDNICSLDIESNL